jgi:hypothetical protein
MKKGHSVTLYPYDPEPRPGTLGADFDSNNPNESFTKRYEKDELAKMLADVTKWMGMDQ